MSNRSERLSEILPCVSHFLVDLTCTALLTAVPVYLLECTPDENAVQLLHRTLEKGGVL